MNVSKIEKNKKKDKGNESFIFTLFSVFFMIWIFIFNFMFSFVSSEGTMVSIFYFGLAIFFIPLLSICAIAIRGKINRIVRGYTILLLVYTAIYIGSFLTGVSLEPEGIKIIFQIIIVLIFATSLAFWFLYIGGWGWKELN